MLLRIALIGLAFVAALGVAACSMVSSTLIEEGAFARCSSDAGFYYLPKTHLLVEVEAADAAQGDKQKVKAAKWHQISIKRMRLPDSERGYCLDYLARSNYQDTITVKKYDKAPLLGLVSSDATDRSLEIAELFIRTIFTAISGNPDYKLTSDGRSFVDTTSGEVTVFRADYDPFDPDRSAGINESLSDFGFCLILEQYTFDLSASSIDAYCDHPYQAFGSHPPHHYTYTHGKLSQPGSGLGHPAAADPTSVAKGLFYRPRIPYQLYIFAKDNLQARGGWALRATHPVELENIAPILSIGLDRTAFAQRKTTLVFDEGMLQDACHYKGSEFVEAVELPLTVVQSVVALPANILSVRIDQTEGVKDLIKAQDEAIKTQTRYLADLNDLAEKATYNVGNPTSPDVRKKVPLFNGSYTGQLTTQKKTDAQIDTSLSALGTNVWSNACGTNKNQKLSIELSKQSVQ